MMKGLTNKIDTSYVDYGKNNTDGEKLAKVLIYYGLIPDVYQKEGKIICPVHADINPSFSYNLETGLFNCFGCEAGGRDLFRLVKQIENARGNSTKDIDIQYILAKAMNNKKCANIKIPQRKVSYKVQIEEEKHLYDCACDFYYGLKKSLWSENKGFNAEPEKQEAYDYMKKRGFNASALNKARAKITYNQFYPIVFPMYDNGKFRGYVCRTFNKFIEQKRKYLYNKGFSRASTLVGDYGYERTGKKYVIICEGYLDRLKMVQYGINNAVAILGWKITDKQIEKLKKAGIKRVISALDNDECGRNGTEYLRKHFEVVQFAFLRGIKDIGEMTKEQFNKCWNKTKERILAINAELKKRREEKRKNKNKAIAKNKKNKTNGGLRNGTVKQNKRRC